MFNTARTSLLLVGLCLIMVNVQASEKSICGTDDRASSFDPKIARALGSLTARGGCTITMIGKRCAISAGHCDSTFDFVQFNVPESSDRGIINHSSSEDTYRVDKDTIVSVDRGAGNDWAVMQILPHADTGKLAGEENGFYEVAFDGLDVGDSVSVTGYGYDANDPERNFTQQNHEDVVVSLNGAVLKHTIDTMGGNSGSSVIRTSDRKIVAVHTHGGCAYGGNSSTYIKERIRLKSAIRSCLTNDQ